MNILTIFERELDHVMSIVAPTKDDVSGRYIRAFLMVCKASTEGDPLSTEDLVRLLGVPRRVADQMVDYLVNTARLVERRLNVDDKRQRLLCLTDDGVTAAKRISASLHRDFGPALKIA